MAFDKLLGQTRVKNTLSEIALSGRIGHAYVFNGPQGVGKKTFSREFSAEIMCPTPKPDGRRCGTCECCILMDNQTNPDYKVIKAQDGKSSIGVEMVRNLQDDIIMAPVFGNRKIYAIESADLMTEQAQNALLKILEEPPHYAVLILLCNNILSLIDTIKSRVIRIDFVRNTDEEIKEKYREICEENGTEAIEDRMELLCSYADGIMGRAVEFTDGGELEAKRNRIIEALGMLLKGDFGAKLELEKLIDVRNGGYEFAMFTMISFLSDTMKISRFGSKAKIMNPDHRDDAITMSRNTGYAKAKKCIKIINETYSRLLKNAAPDLAVSNMLIKLRELK